MWAPPNLIEDWDNTGFQIGEEEKEINRILIALDLDNDVYKYANEKKFDMIITHHPLIFKPISTITTSMAKERLIYNLIKSGIVVFNAHTNLDQAQGGVSDELARLLELKDCVPLIKNELKGFQSEYGYGKVGDIEEIDLYKYLDFVKEKLDISHLVIYGEQDKRVKRVAVCGGSGADFIQNAHEENACIYITGDIKYHDAQLGNELNLTIIDAGHYHTEKAILPVIKEYIEKKSNDNLCIEIWDNPSPIYKLY